MFLHFTSLENATEGNLIYVGMQNCDVKIKVVKIQVQVDLK